MDPVDTAGLDTTDEAKCRAIYEGVRGAVEGGMAALQVRDCFSAWHPPYNAYGLSPAAGLFSRHNRRPNRALLLSVRSRTLSDPNCISKCRL